jgi:hypothetical protein
MLAYATVHRKHGMMFSYISDGTSVIHMITLSTMASSFMAVAHVVSTSLSFYMA